MSESLRSEQWFATPGRPIASFYVEGLFADSHCQVELVRDHQPFAGAAPV